MTFDDTHCTSHYVNGFSSKSPYNNNTCPNERVYATTITRGVNALNCIMSNSPLTAIIIMYYCVTWPSVIVIRRSLHIGTKYVHDRRRIVNVSVIRTLLFYDSSLVGCNPAQKIHYLYHTIVLFWMRFVLSSTSSCIIRHTTILISRIWNFKQKKSSLMLWN